MKRPWIPSWMQSSVWRFGYGTALISFRRSVISHVSQEAHEWLHHSRKWTSTVYWGSDTWCHLKGNLQMSVNACGWKKGPNFVPTCVLVLVCNWRGSSALASQTKKIATQQIKVALLPMPREQVCPPKILKRNAQQVDKSVFQHIWKICQQQIQRPIETYKETIERFSFGFQRRHLFRVCSGTHIFLFLLYYYDLVFSSANMNDVHFYGTDL